MCSNLIETDRGLVEYSDTGSGEPILYFHGSGVTGDAMVAVESPIVDGGFRLIVPNRPGYGRTPLAPNTSAVDCANVAAALLDSIGLARVHVMGSSGGGAFAASFAVTHTERTKSLVLLCPQLHRWASSQDRSPFVRFQFLHFPDHTGSEPRYNRPFITGDTEWETRTRQP